LKRRELRTEAETIIEQRQSLEITAAEARQRVELLLRALRSWASDSKVEPRKRSRTYNAPPLGKGEILTADVCPLFFKDDIEDDDDVCPLDMSHSEVWGASVMFCRYVCAPSLD